MDGLEIKPQDDSILKFEKTYVVYKHTNIINGKVYIGMTSRLPEDRWGKDGERYSRQVFWNAIQKYGWDNFRHDILFDNLTFDEACTKEIELIQQCNSTDNRYGYNVALGGMDNNYSKSCKKVYQYDLSGNFLREFCSTAEAGRYMNCHATIIACACRAGVNHIRYKFRWSYQYLGKKLTDEEMLSPISKRVYCYDLEGDYLGFYDSTGVAAKQLKVSESEISLCCTGKTAHVKQYRFFYQYQDENIESLHLEVRKNGAYYSREKPVYQYDKNGKFIQEFESITHAKKQLGINRIRTFDPKTLHLCHGYYWMFTKVESIDIEKIKKGEGRKA